MKDRIKAIMEHYHMNQQMFAQFVNVSSATLSGIFNGRTKPTLPIVESIKNKIPNLSVEWLMFGSGAMFFEDSGTDSKDDIPTSDNESEAMIDFGSQPDSPTPSLSDQPKAQSVQNTPNKIAKTEVKFIDKPQRHITEIRVFYDDQTWETFAPKK